VIPPAGFFTGVLFTPSGPSENDIFLEMLSFTAPSSVAYTGGSLVVAGDGTARGLHVSADLSQTEAFGPSKAAVIDATFEEAVYEISGWIETRQEAGILTAYAGYIYEDNEDEELTGNLYFLVGLAGPSIGEDLFFSFGGSWGGGQLLDQFYSTHAAYSSEINGDAYTQHHWLWDLGAQVLPGWVGDGDYGTYLRLLGRPNSFVHTPPGTNSGFSVGGTFYGTQSTCQQGVSIGGFGAITEGTGAFPVQGTFDAIAYGVLKDASNNLFFYLYLEDSTGAETIGIDVSFSVDDNSVLPERLVLSTGDATREDVSWSATDVWLWDLGYTSATVPSGWADYSGHIVFT
jgi:hypothetical protein